MSLATGPWHGFPFLFRLVNFLSPKFWNRDSVERNPLILLPDSILLYCPHIHYIHRFFYLSRISYHLFRTLLHLLLRRQHVRRCPTGPFRLQSTPFPPIDLYLLYPFPIITFLLQDDNLQIYSHQSVLVNLTISPTCRCRRYGRRGRLGRPT